MTTAVYIADLYEYQNGAVTKYYEGGAIRRTGYAGDNGVFYTLSDHLHSTSVLVNQNGTVNSRDYYYPYGGNRNGAFSSLTTKRFTGQYHEQGLPGGEGLYYYNARWYDARLARFVSADTVVPNPGNPQALNRYSYVLGNPLRYQDPTGYRECEDVDCLHTGPVMIKPPSKGGGGGSAANNYWRNLTPWIVAELNYDVDRPEVKYMKAYNGLATAFMARKLYGPATCAKAQAYQTFTPLVKSDGP
ncbi:MAG: RHS repeat-associated core domain-containing protein, partial [Chloroflexi bacterium]|nr:RHS repeat-associated core domain-containing protein [Chloroflexota bacterium]